MTKRRHNEQNLAVAAHIRQRRTQLGLSQADVARKMGIGVLTASRIESGERVISVDDLLGLADALSTTPDILLRPVELCPTCGGTGLAPDV